MPEQDASLYDVRSQLSGAQVIIGVDFDTATNECARLNAEARVVDPWRGEPMGLHKGKQTRYEVVAVSGLAIAGGE